MKSATDFIRAQTRLVPVDGLSFGGVPLRLWLADEVAPVWTATQANLDRHGIEPPFWAFAWAGGQAAARLILEKPELVRGRRVLDIACGSGLIAIAAARAGAAHVLANDIDPLCEAATQLNAEANGAAVHWLGGNLLDGPPPAVDIIVAGDIFYQRQMATRFLDWLRPAAASGVRVYVGDPGRAYAPPDAALPLAEYDIPTTVDLEGVTERRARVWQLTGAL